MPFTLESGDFGLHLSFIYTISSSWFCSSPLDLIWNINALGFLDSQWRWQILDLPMLLNHARQFLMKALCVYTQKQVTGYFSGEP